MNKADLLKALDKVEKFAKSSKLSRWRHKPYKYTHAILFRELHYKVFKQRKTLRTKTFFNWDMQIALPSSTDIYLAGAKTHDSEIRLTRFLIHSLEKGDTFLDVGAHYGFYSLLAALLTGRNGSVYSFEASPGTFKVLQNNTTAVSNIHSFLNAVYDTNESLTFYEFPNLYSEYNTADASQFEKNKWFTENQPVAIEVETIVLDDFLSKQGVVPKLVKIDVEGAEYNVINGMQSHLKHHSPVIIMEYLSRERGDVADQKAGELLSGLKYDPYVIKPDGNLQSINDIPAYLHRHKLESDNIVFIKRN